MPLRSSHTASRTCITKHQKEIYHKGQDDDDDDDDDNDDRNGNNSHMYDTLQKYTITF